LLHPSYRRRVLDRRRPFVGDDRAGNHGPARPLPRLLVPKDVEGSGLLADTGAFPRRGKNITVVGCYFYGVVEVARTIVR
jgi:hypothetical protein